jgi:hypothetical protein
MLSGGSAWARIGHDQALRANLTSRSPPPHHLSANARTRHKRSSLRAHAGLFVSSSRHFYNSDRSPVARVAATSAYITEYSDWSAEHTCRSELLINQRKRLRVIRHCDDHLIPPVCGYPHNCALCWCRSPRPVGRHDDILDCEFVLEVVSSKMPTRSAMIST